jgi:hypothetical protein
MTRPFRGTINLDARDSTPDWEAFLPDRAPGGSPNVRLYVNDELLAEANDFRTTYGPGFAYTGGRVVKVVSDVADDAYVDVERHLWAAMARA